MAMTPVLSMAFVERRYKKKPNKNKADSTMIVAVVEFHKPRPTKVEKPGASGKSGT